MAVEYWLISGDKKLRLPVNPASNSYTSPFEYDDYEVEALGEVTAIKRRGLREFTIESFFPADYNPAYCGYSGFPTPQKCISIIEGMRNARTPIQYVVTGAGGVNIKATIREFQLDAERAGNPGDIFYTLTIKEFRDVTITTVDTAKKSTAKPATSTAKRPAAPAKAQPKTYTVKSGDCLTVIAKKIYGSSASYTKIYNANKKLIGPNPNKLKVGMKLVIPA